jgi:hypothetical protein
LDEVSEKLRKNLGLLAIAVVVAGFGLITREVFDPLGALILLGAGIAAAVAVFEIGLELLRD